MKRILIVDDTAFMRLVIRRALEENGFNVVGEAENGRIGVRKYWKLKPDLVTMDITMPEMSGMEALKWIMQFDPKAKIIMMSAMGQGTMVDEAMRYGAKSFIIKPFNKAHFLETINSVLSL
jgi:two-component system chemotaxis response regulator CheY